jgi:hypothetical protein
MLPSVDLVVLDIFARDGMGGFNKFTRERHYSNGQVNYGSNDSDLVVKLSLQQCFEWANKRKLEIGIENPEVKVRIRLRLANDLYEVTNYGG